MIDLRHFQKSEFRDSWPYMSVRLLILEDTLRHRWGDRIDVSPVTGALGRRNGPDDDSQHNIDRWEEVRAMDQFLKGMDNRAAAELAIQLMKEIGFTGIGLYPHWDPWPGIHGDVRIGRAPGNPAVWGMLKNDKGKQYQVTLLDALREMG